MEVARSGLWAPALHCKKVKEKEIVKKRNTYNKLLIAMISRPSYMWAIRIKAPYLILIIYK